MRPKTFPAAPYVGNTRQRLQEIKEGLKQPAKLVSQALHGGSSRTDGGRGADCKSGKDTASRQQQIRPPQKFNNYQNALREIRRSLMPFANESGPSSGSGHPAGAGEVNRQMLQELVNAGCDQEMAVRALKQTGSRNIEAALEYISKMGYLDPRNELIVRVIKQTSPGKAGMPNSMDHRPALEAPGEAGVMPPYHQMGAPMYEGAGGYGPEGEMPRPYMSAPPVMNYMMPPSGGTQGPAMGNPMGRPPSMGSYPQVMATQSNPANTMYPPGAQQKGYPGSMEQHGPMMSYNVPGQPLQLQPQPPGGPVAGPHYDYGHTRPHMMEPAGYGVKRTASFQNKMAPPPMAPPDNYVNMQGKGAMGQNGPGGGGGGYPANLYLSSHSHPRQASPTSHQVHMMSRSPGGVAAMGPDFSDMPQGLMTPSRASLNLDLYEHHWAGPPGPESAPQARQPQPQGPFRGEVRVPSRTNSFNSRSAGPSGVRPAMAAPPTAGKQDSSLGPPNTITAVTSPPIQQPVKSIRVMRPEPKTAVGPCHPSWMTAQAQDAAEPLTYMPEETYTLEPAPEPRCPPPPYPKNLLMSGPEEGAGVLCGAQDLSSPAARSTRGDSGGSGKAEERQQVKEKTKMGKGEKTVKDKKQIQTSPVPVRKNGRDEEKRESRIKTYSPFAFKFYMEQHIENVMKTHQQKLNRRLQLEQEMSKAGLSEAEQEQMRKMLNQKESNYNRLRRAKMDKSMFVKIKTLGIGAFGEVCLTRKVDTGALYAMKTLRKKDVLNRNQVAHVKAERDILAEADNEWVVRLYYSFQDRDSLYFVMDYIPGGDMMSLLIRMGVFAEPLARFYVAELTLAIESVHRMGFIHRDIKPDNILIDLDGHIKLTDFGLCTGFRWTHNSKYYQKGSHVRQDSMEPSDFWDDVSKCRCGDRLMTLEQRANRQHQRCLAHSLVGTPNYIAPEVLLRKGYTQLCDWWSVGVILFEMLVGQPPFLAPTPTETQIKVINWESTLQVPAQVKLSPEAVDIIGRLCCSAEDRLGANGAGEIKAHPFFTQMDFSSNLRQQPAPYRPKIAHPMDTSNFDPVEEEGGPGAWRDSGDSTRALDTLCSPHGKHPEHAFYEFTFRRFFDDNGCPFRYPKPLEASEVSPSMGPEEEDEQEEDEDEEEEGEQGEGCEPVYV
ncbi:hypothetical protein EPR50_G00114860 [Perca flavescens]|uniref:non-specific serine/threonine protein kinase n=1 Tax=Perca flavescens TaxID=8167 RepID=A0A484CUP0_PERFV|nr:serine/threonine-protein kinase LATS2 [Perca flavescens]TDH06568.1 hypothetical protein EPR50_G00114860 [Perca flavescens]